MQSKTAWEWFKESGRVEAYLLYCTAVREDARQQMPQPTAQPWGSEHTEALLSQ